MTLGGRRFLLGLAVAAASLCLALGVSLPFVKLTKFMFFTYEHSLISAVNALIRSGQFFLGMVVLVFCIFLPVMKLLYLLLLVMLPLRDIERLARPLRALEWLGKWSLYDVLVLSLTISFIQSQGTYDGGSASGIYFFAAAVLLMLLAHTWLRREVTASRMRVSATKAAYSSAMRSLAFNLLLIVATVCFALGAMLPAIRFTSLYAGSNQHSVASIIWALYARDEYFPCFVLFTLSILLPCMKLLYLLALIISRNLPFAVRVKSIPAMEWLGRYSITDAMALALVVFYLSASGYADASVLPGAYLFAASALMTMLAYGWANSLGPTTTQRSSLAARLAGLASPETPGETLARR